MLHTQLARKEAKRAGGDEEPYRTAPPAMRLQHALARCQVEDGVANADCHKNAPSASSERRRQRRRADEARPCDKSPVHKPRARIKNYSQRKLQSERNRVVDENTRP